MKQRRNTPHVSLRSCGRTTTKSLDKARLRIEYHRHSVALGLLDSCGRPHYTGLLRTVRVQGDKKKETIKDKDTIKDTAAKELAAAQQICDAAHRAATQADDELKKKEAETQRCTNIHDVCKAKMKAAEVKMNEQLSLHQRVQAEANQNFPEQAALLHSRATQSASSIGHARSMCSSPVPPGKG